jgi:hypothetical protein
MAELMQGDTCKKGREKNQAHCYFKKPVPLLQVYPGEPDHQQNEGPVDKDFDARRFPNVK